MERTARFSWDVESMGILLLYQRRMEQFYSVLAEVFREYKYRPWPDFDRCGYVPDPNLVLFGYDVYGEPDELEEMLGHVAEKGYRIVMNFYAADVVLGNLAVKIRDRWFAFGRCRNEGPHEWQATEIWPLRYVLPRMRKMEIRLRYAIPVRPFRNAPKIADLPSH